MPEQDSANQWIAKVKSLEVKQRPSSTPKHQSTFASDKGRLKREPTSPCGVLLGATQRLDSLLRPTFATKQEHANGAESLGGTESIAGRQSDQPPMELHATSLETFPPATQGRRGQAALINWLSSARRVQSSFASQEFDINPNVSGSEVVNSLLSI